MLMESETTKLKERDEKHQAQVAAWKAELGPRKKVRYSRVTAVDKCKLQGRSKCFFFPVFQGSFVIFVY